MTPTRLTLWLAVVFGLVTSWLGLRMESADTFRDPSELAKVSGILLWTLSPYALLVTAARFGKYLTIIWGAPAVLFIVGLYGNVTYANENFYLLPKSYPSKDFVFLFMPFVQNVVAVVSIGVLLAIGAWLDRRKRP